MHLAAAVILKLAWTEYVIYLHTRNHVHVSIKLAFHHATVLFQ